MTDSNLRTENSLDEKAKMQMSSIMPVLDQARTGVICNDLLDLRSKTFDRVDGSASLVNAGVRSASRRGTS
jgi:hypothetical protein